MVQYKVGITLSGGGFRGIAHVGVLQYLRESGIHPEIISGASAGSLIGAFFAQGYSPEEILAISKKEKLFTYSDIAWKAGLFSTSIIERLVQKYIPHNSFESLQIPLFVSVTDLTHAESLIFSEGKLSFAVKASCCFPLVFQPVKNEDGSFLCDGGLLNNFPVEEIRPLCKKVIGINVDPLSTFEGPAGYKNIIARIIRMTTALKATHSRHLCDVYMEPEELNQFSTFETQKIDSIFQVGYNFAKKHHQELDALI